MRGGYFLILNKNFFIGVYRSYSLFLEYDELTYPYVTCCSLCAVFHLYDFWSNKLDSLCDKFEPPYGTHHRVGDNAKMCSRLFLREIVNADGTKLGKMMIAIECCDQ